MISFNPSTGFSVDDIDTVREQVRQEWIKAFAAEGRPPLDTSPETPAGQLIDSQTASIAQKDTELIFLASQFNPRYAEGVWQDALAKIYFLERHQATPSTVTLTCTGLSGTVIPAGAIVRSEDNQTSWSCTRTTRIGMSGRVNVPFACTVNGTVEGKARTLCNIGTTVSGWDTAINEKDAVIGNNEESQAAFEARRRQSVALNSRSSLQSVYSRIMALNGVISCCLRQNRKDTAVVVDKVTLKPHSVYACVLGGDENEIAMAMYNTVSAGCAYTGETDVEVTDPVTGSKDTVSFSRPTDMPIGVKVVVRKNTQTLPNPEKVIKDAIFDNFYGVSNEYINDQPVLRVIGDTTVYASRFYISLLNKGFNEILSIQMAMPFQEFDDEAEDPNSYSSIIKIPININPTLDRTRIIVDVQG